LIVHLLSSLLAVVPWWAFLMMPLMMLGMVVMMWLMMRMMMGMNHGSHEGAAHAGGEQSTAPSGSEVEALRQQVAELQERLAAMGGEPETQARRSEEGEGQ
jgi:hypothetical protein